MLKMEIFYGLQCRLIIFSRYVYHCVKVIAYSFSDIIIKLLLKTLTLYQPRPREECFWTSLCNTEIKALCERLHI